MLHPVKRLAVLLSAGILFASGCGDTTDYSVSGKVTFKGQPVKKGFISFEPDGEKGNKGPGGGAPIVDGNYSTPRGKGMVGGPYLVKIIGFDGVPTSQSGEELPDGKALFPIYQVEVDFPKQNTNQDFDVPADAVKPKPKPGKSGDGL